MVDDFGDGDVVDVDRALLALVVVDENHLGCLAGHRLDQPRRRCCERIQHELGLGADGPESHRLDVRADFCFQIRVGQRRTN